ncbi:hypothetical protein E0493_21630 [Roseomonas sp. M0104]|uniref:Uncharacterized protein n=1 Tax=Teichococcus coralli TaxID=2545983 RepID=A0A845BLC6_9PROT|nr:hypothetical protein [Pseudoroseomonas coralli]MXP65952.1 hypothetical protein [Pseudoroseomonas coralli]
MSWFGVVVGVCVDLIRSFNNKEIAFACAFGLLLSGFAIWATCILPPHLKVVRAFLAAAAEARRIRQETGLASDQRIAALGKALASRRPLADVWETFRASVRESPLRKAEYVSPIDARAWFTPERLPGGGPEAWCGTLASISLTFGLLLTFVGLSAGLFALGGGTDPASLREGINKLLGISAAKFITSIAGIMAFIGWTLIGRVHTSLREWAAHALAAAVDAVVPHLPPEALLIEQLKASQEAGLATRQLSSDLHVALDRNFKVVGDQLEGFRDSLTPALDRSVQPVVEAIHGMSERIGNDNQAALQQMAQGFLGGMQDAAGAEMRALAETLGEAVTALSVTKAGIGESGAEFGRSLQAAAEQMAGSATAIAETMDGRLAAIEARMRSLDESLSAGAGRIDEAGARMSARVGEGIEKALQGLAAAAAENARAAQTQAEAGMGPILEAMRALVGEVRASAERTRSDLEAGGQSASAEIARAASEISGSASRMAETFDARMADVEARMARLDAAIASGAGHIDAAGSRMSERVAAGIDQAVNGLATAGAEHARAAHAQAEAGMAPVLAALRDLVAEVHGSAERTRGELESGGRGASEQMLQAAQGMAVSASRMAETFDARMADVEQRLSRLDTTLSAGAGRIDEAGARMSTQVTQGVERVMSGLANAGVETAKATRAQAEAGMEPVLAALKALALEVGTSAQRTRGDLESGGRAASEAMAEATRGMGAQFQAAATQAGTAVADAFGQGAKHLVAEMAAAAERQKAASDGLAQRLDGLERALSGIEQAMSRQVSDLGRVGQTLTTAGSTVATASDRLGAAATPVGETLKAVGTALETVRQALGEVTTASTTARQSTEAISTAAQAAETSFRSYVQRFEDTDRALATTVGTLREGVIDLHSQAVTTFGTIDTQLSKALGSLKDAVENMADVLSDTKGKVLAGAGMGGN